MHALNNLLKTCVLMVPGAQTTTPTFGSSPGFGQQTGFGAQGGGSRLTPFTSTPEEGASSTAGQTAKLESISAMPAYKDKSHEELRWEDYQRGDKGSLFLLSCFCLFLYFMYVILLYVHQLYYFVL